MGEFEGDSKGDIRQDMEFAVKLRSVKVQVRSGQGQVQVRSGSV